MVKKELREKIGKKAGDKVTLAMDIDASPLVLHVPDDLSRALAGNTPAKAYFDKVAHSHKKAFIEWIEGAKRPETRARRVARALEMLSKAKVL